MGINNENLIDFFSNQLSLLKKSKKRRAIVFFGSLILIGLIGEFESFYIKKNGVYVTATILDVENAPRGRYGATIKYSYRHRPYQDIVSFNPNFLNMESNGKRLIVVLLPKHPTRFVCLEYTPDCLGDSPPEGWTEIPECE